MKAKYYPEDDLLVLQLAEQPYEYAEKVGTFMIHYSKTKEPVLIEILHAAEFLRSATSALPHRTVEKLLHH